MYIVVSIMDFNEGDIIQLTLQAKGFAFCAGQYAFVSILVCCSFSELILILSIYSYNHSSWMASVHYKFFSWRSIYYISY